MPALLILLLFAVAPAKSHADPQSAPLTPYACNRGDDRGICYMDGQGNVIYWIVRRWGAGGPDGPEWTGYADLQRQQQAYNRWSEAARELTTTYRVKQGEDELLSDQPFAAVGFKPWIPSKVWEYSDPAIPQSLPEDGRASLATLLIPYYETAAAISADWRRLQIACHFVELQRTRSPAYDVCYIALQDYDHGRFDDVDAAVETWADRLKAAYQLSRGFQDTLATQDFASLPPEQQNLTRETLPGAFLSDYETTLSDIRARLNEAAVARASVQDRYLR